MHERDSDDDFIEEEDEDYDEELEEDEASLERLRNQDKKRRRRRVVASEVGSIRASVAPKTAQKVPHVSPRRSVRSSRAKVSDLRPAGAHTRQSRTTKQVKEEANPSLVKEIFGTG